MTQREFKRDDAAEAQAIAWLDRQTVESKALTVPNKDATEEQMAAKKAIIAERLKDRGVDPEKAKPFEKAVASSALVTKDGDFRILVTKRALEDAKALANGQKRFTYAKDGKTTAVNEAGEKVEVAHKAGDKREVSATARLLRHNVNALSNRKTGKEGLDGIDMSGKNAANAYLNVDVLKENLKQSKFPGTMLKALQEAANSTAGMTASMQFAKFHSAQKAAGQSR